MMYGISFQISTFEGLIFGMDEGQRGCSRIQRRHLVDDCCRTRFHWFDERFQPAHKLQLVLAADRGEEETILATIDVGDEIEVS